MQLSKSRMNVNVVKKKITLEVLIAIVKIVSWQKEGCIIWKIGKQLKIWLG